MDPTLHKLFALGPKGIKGCVRLVSTGKGSCEPLPFVRRPRAACLFGQRRPQRVRCCACGRWQLSARERERTECWTTFIQRLSDAKYAGHCNKAAPSELVRADRAAGCCVVDARWALGREERSSHGVACSPRTAQRRISLQPLWGSGRDPRIDLRVSQGARRSTKRSVALLVRALEWRRKNP